MLHILQEETSFDKLIGKDNPIIVFYFTATWCMPCKMVWPKVQKLSKEYENYILFIKIDVDDFNDLSTFCDVTCMPTFQFYRQGEKNKFDSLEGANEQELEMKCRNALSN